jgi:hypothetical protein
MKIELTVAFSLFFMVLGGVIGYLTYKRSLKKDAEEKGKGDGILLTEIGYIKAGVDDIKRKQDKQDDLYMRLAERVTAVESSSSQAHKRIDRLEAANSISK